MRFGISDRLGAAVSDETAPVEVPESDIEELEIIEEETPKEGKSASRKRAGK